VLGQAGAEEVGGLEEVPIGRDDEVLLGHVLTSPDPEANPGNDAP